MNDDDDHYTGELALPNGDNIRRRCIKYAFLQVSLESVYARSLPHYMNLSSISMPY